jgi:protein FAM50
MSGEGSSGSLPSFQAPKVDTAGALASQTVGLVSKEEFTRRREALELQQQQQEAAASAAGGGGDASSKKKKKKKKATGGGVLSFGGDDEDDAEGPPVEVKKLKKNPSVDTSMLYDADRAAEEARRREELAKEWLEKEQRAKAEKLEVHYSYHDPSGRDGLKGHRNTVTIEKGYTIERFLDCCRQQVPQLRGCGADQLIYVKEDLILPHSLTFYELIVKRARGKSGPLFNFDVHDDVRVGPSDSRVEKDESHPGKVMMRHVYTRLKEQFPYSRFEVYDPDKKWDTYTTHGGETYGEGTETSIGNFGVIRPSGTGSGSSAP